MGKIKFSHNSFLAIIITSLSLLFSIAFSTETYADCIDGARSALGAGYVNTFITAFNSRCSNISNSGSYGLVVPTSTDFPETSRSGSFSFDAQRIVYTKNRSGDDWGGVMSLSSATFSASRLSCQVNKGGWYTGDSMTVTIPDASILSSSGGDEGILEDSLEYVSCLKHDATSSWRSVSQCRQNTLYFKVYKITYPGIDSQTVSYGGTDYTNATSSSAPVTVEDGQITFSHVLKRNDTWDKPANPTINATYTLGHTGGSTSGWTNASFTGKTSSTITDIVNISDLNLEPNVPKEVCSTITYRNVKSLSNNRTAYNDSASNSTSSTICIWVKDDRIFLTPNSRSSVDNSINGNKSATTGNTETLDAYGGSRGATRTFTFSFVHQLKVSGGSSYSRTLDYYVERSVNGGSSWSAVANEGTSSSPKTLSVNGNDTYVTAEANSWVSDPIAQGSATPTVCERITFRPKKVEVKVSSGVQTVTDNNWQTSTVCSIVRRRAPKSVNLTAESHVWVDGANKDATSPVYSVNSPRSIQFKFDIKNADGSNRALSTNYVIERIVYTAGGSEDWSQKTDVKSGNNIVTPTSSPITDTFNITIDPGTSKTICERIKLNPYQFKIHLDGNNNEEGSPESVVGDGWFANRCVTIARPALTWRDDGDIEVFSESSGALDNPSQTGGTVNISGTAAYLLKTASADITYTHKLWRNAEKHTGDGTHQADVISPEEDVTVEYRFADPATTFTATSIKNAVTLPSHAIATNTAGSKYSFQSNRTDPLLNTNTQATASEVGTLYEQCQTIDYLSKTYTLRGQYWELDGQIFSNSPNIQAVGTPVSKNTVGKSARGCVNVIRPWNFKATNLTSNDDISKPVTVGSSQRVKFDLSVGKNDASYMITDIPNATIRFVAFTAFGEVASLNFSGSLDTANDPCSHFAGQIAGISCNTLEERTNQNLGPAGATGKKFYSSNNYDVTIQSNNFTIPDLATNDKYCLAVGVKPANSGDGFNMSSNWVISSASCFNIGKYPNFQAWGGGIFTNGGTKTSRTTIENKSYGSWTDFAIIANKSVLETGSGASLISGLESHTDCKLSPLTIANDNCNGTDTSRSALGGASISVATANFKQKLADRYLNDVQNYTITSEINTESLNGTARNPRFFYNPDGDIYISANIIPSSYTTRSYGNPNIPQVIVYAKNGNILINENVNNIQAWLIADKQINTCVNSSKVTPPLSASTCNSPLVIGGPVVAEKVLMNRTYGADAHTNTLPNYAELVNLSGAVYLFSANEASGAQPVTTYLQKLPPRY